MTMPKAFKALIRYHNKRKEIGDQVREFDAALFKDRLREIHDIKRSKRCK